MSAEVEDNVDHGGKRRKKGVFQKVTEILSVLKLIQKTSLHQILKITYL